tara:strand:- start:46 stop:594 length:549 start_codon:yes stop_codon:yes gene_type:complete
MLFQICFAWLYSHLLEWFLHKHVLHKPKRKKWFKTHFGEHHKSAKKLLMVDPKYIGKISMTGDPEIKGLLLLGLMHVPVFFFWPVAYITLLFCAFSYWIQHRWAHRNMTFARENMPWHYDHHMAKDQHKNWGVRLPIFDYLFGTRVVYKGTKNERIKYILKRSRLEARVNEIRSHRNRNRGS